MTETNDLERLRSLMKRLESIDEFTALYVKLVEQNGTIMFRLRVLLHEQVEWLSMQPRGEA